MKDIQRVGPYVDIVEARDPLNSALVVKLGLRESGFQQVVQNGNKTPVAQYYGIVQDCLLEAVHCFQGLKRPLLDVDSKEDIGKDVLVYSWRPAFDFVWSHSRFDGNPTARTPPPNRVFAVLVRKEPQPNIFPGVGTVYGSIERWNWLKEDPIELGAPVDWQERYESRMWSRSI
jgi:hypothetical protein